MLIEQLANELQKLRIVTRDATLRCDLRGSMDQRRVAEVMRVHHQPLRFMRQGTGKIAGDVLLQRLVLGIAPLVGNLLREATNRRCGFGRSLAL